MKSILTFIILIANQTVLIGQTLKESDDFKKPITIEVEAASFTSQTKDEIRKWVIQSSDIASLKKYIQIMPDTRVTHDDELIKGVNFSNEQGVMAIVSYKVIIPNAGRYYVWVSALSKGGEDNSVHVGIDNTWPETGARMQWCEGKNSWYYESKQRTEAVHCGEPYLIYLDVTKPGKHTIQFSMREDGFAMDKFLITTDKNFKPVNK